MRANCDSPIWYFCISCAEQHHVMQEWAGGEIVWKDCDQCGIEGTLDDEGEIVVEIELPEKHPLRHLRKVGDIDILYATDL